MKRPTPMQANQTLNGLYPIASDDDNDDDDDDNDDLRSCLTTI
jgi:hypothetical protein